MPNWQAKTFTTKRCPMLNVSPFSIPDGGAVVNVGWAGRCDFCGNMFDDGGTCNYGHTQGCTYYYVPEDSKLATSPQNAIQAALVFAPKPEKKRVIVMCQANANHCNICGAFFAEGDNVCEGRHFIGEKYPIYVEQ